MIFKQKKEKVVFLSEKHRKMSTIKLVGIFILPLLMILTTTIEYQKVFSQVYSPCTHELINAGVEEFFLNQGGFANNPNGQFTSEGFLTVIDAMCYYSLGKGYDFASAVKNLIETNSPDPELQNLMDSFAYDTTQEALRLEQPQPQQEPYNYQQPQAGQIDWESVCQQADPLLTEPCNTLVDPNNPYQLTQEGDIVFNKLLCGDGEMLATFAAPQLLALKPVAGCPTNNDSTTSNNLGNLLGELLSP